MSSAASKSEILAARDRRHLHLLEALAAGAPSTLLLSLNIPGEDKSPPGAEELFEWGLARLRRDLPLRSAFRDRDPLGPYAVLLCEAEPREAKEAGIALEEESPPARLLDLDVYDGEGNPTGRREMGFSPRPCLLCGEAAADCMRLSRHDYRSLRARTDELLRPMLP